MLPPLDAAQVVISQFIRLNLIIGLHTQHVACLRFFLSLYLSAPTLLTYKLEKKKKKKNSVIEIYHENPQTFGNQITLGPKKKSNEKL